MRDILATYRDRTYIYIRGKIQHCMLEVCKSDPKPIRSDRIRSDFGTKYSFRIGLIKLFRSRIGSDFDIRNKLMN